MISGICSLAILGTLVLVHELGHFVVARWSGVRVSRFSLGFGPKIWGFRRGDTEYCFCLLPLGGYVKMAGEQQEEQTKAPWEFLSKPPWIRAWIVAAGPLVNLMMSTVLLWIVLVTGYPEMLPTIGEIVEKMPAQSVGIQVGDRIKAINGVEMHTWDQFTATVHRAPNRPLNFQIQRGEESLTLTITPEPKTLPDAFGRLKTVGLVGVVPSGDFELHYIPPLQAVNITFARQWEWTTQIIMSLYSIFTGRLSMQESLTGPIGIVHLTSEAVRMGIGPLLYLISIFSLSLGVFNFFPVPVLDGGHILFIVLEKLRGRPVSIKVQERAIRVGMAALLLLVAMVCVSDMQRLGWMEKLLRWWKPQN